MPPHDSPQALRVCFQNHLVFLTLLSCSMLSQAAESPKGVVTCDTGYSFFLGPAKVGDRNQSIDGTYWYEVKDSQVKIDIDLDTGAVRGSVRQVIRGRFRREIDGEIRPADVNDMTEYEINGEVDPATLLEPVLQARMMMRGTFVLTNSGQTEGKPYRSEPRRGTFHGVVCKNVDKTIEKLPELNDSFIVFYEDPFQPWHGDPASVKGDHPGWVDNRVKDSFVGEQGAFGIVALDLEEKMPTYFIDASADRYDPKNLIEGTFSEDTYYELILSVPNRLYHVKGAATDEATRVWVMVECPGPGEVEFSLPKPNRGGGFIRPEAFSVTEQRIKVKTFHDRGTQKDYAFGLYAPPAVYGAAARSASEHRRTVAIHSKWEPDKTRIPAANTREQDDNFTLIRPPIVLVHGTFDNPSYCWQEFPQTGWSKADYPAGHSAMFGALTRAGFVLPNGKPAVSAVDYEGKQVGKRYTSSGLSEHERVVSADGQKIRSSNLVNLSHVLWENPGGIKDALKDYRDLGFAVTQADVICHSLGGLVARAYIRGANLYKRGPQKRSEYPAANKAVWYYRPENFMKGDVHRLITISTTHRGSDAPGMLVPFQAMLNLKVAGNEVPSTFAGPAPTLRASDVTQPGSMSMVEHTRILTLLTAVDKLTGTGGAFRDQQPNSPALNALGSTPVPSHAIACISQDTDLLAFQADAWNRMDLILRLAPYSVIRSVLLPREYGPESYQALLRAGGETELAQQSWLASLFQFPPVRPQTGAEAVARRHQFVSVFRSVVFGNTPNDTTVRQDSSLGGLTPGTDAKIIDNVLHAFAPTYPSVQQHVLQLLRGGYRQFNMNGFPAAGGKMKNLPPPTVDPAPKPSSVIVAVEQVSGKATRLNDPQKKIEALEQTSYRGSHQSFAIEGGTAQLQVGIEGLDNEALKALMNAQQKPTLFHIGNADAKEKRIVAYLSEGSVRVDKEDTVSCVMQLYTPAVMIENLHTRYVVTHDHDTQRTQIEVLEGKVRVYPLDGSPAYVLEAPKLASHETPATPIAPRLDGDQPALAQDGRRPGDSQPGDIASSTDSSTPPDVKRSTIDPPKGPFDSEIIVLGDGTRIDATSGRRIIDPPKGPFDREIILGPQSTPWAEPPVEGDPRLLRTMVYHQLFDNQADQFDRYVIYIQPILSADGSRAVFCGKGAYVIDYDGSNLLRLGEAKTSVVSNADISPDGQWVAYYDQYNVFAARAQGGEARALLESSYGAFYGVRVRGKPPTVFLVCATPAKLRIRPDAPWEPFGNGIWAIDPTSGARRHLVDFAQMAKDEGLPNHTYLSVATQGYFAFDASENGRHLVFALYSKQDKVSRVYAWSIEGGIRELIRFKNNLINSLCISGDGRTVAYVTRGKEGALFTMGFDGSNHREVLKATDAPARFTEHISHSRLTHDGSLFFHGMDNLLVNLDDGHARNIGPVYTSSINSVLDYAMFRPDMNRDASRFVFVSRQKSGRTTLTSLAINPTSVGKAPHIGEVLLDPAQLVSSKPGPKLTAKVTTDLNVTHTRSRVFSQAHLDKAFSYRDLRDDGQAGDEQAGDGLYSYDNFLPGYGQRASTGPRVIRVLIQGLDENELAHATAVDYGPWPVAP